MIIIKSKIEIKKMRQAGNVLAELFSAMASIIYPGLTTLQLDSWIEQELSKRNLVSQSKGYNGYQHASCISINDEVVHGIPSKNRVLKEGDLVKVDICAALDGYCADMARSFVLGKSDESVAHFVDVARSALQKGMEQARPGNRLSDISAAIQGEVERNGFGVIRDFAGHGIGRSMHEEPEILNYGKSGLGPVLKPGMTFALEPMITMGKSNVYISNDGWTVKTVDKSLAAHVEDTIAITEGDPLILTRMLQEGMHS
jgi:methionyl aminopeptidase